MDMVICAVLLLMVCCSSMQQSEAIHFGYDDSPELGYRGPRGYDKYKDKDKYNEVYFVNDGTGGYKNQGYGSDDGYSEKNISPDVGYNGNGATGYNSYNQGYGGDGREDGYARYSDNDVYSHNDDYNDDDDQGPCALATGNRENKLVNNPNSKTLKKTNKKKPCKTKKDADAWRSDYRCANAGYNVLAPNGQPAICSGGCCSSTGWCGVSSDHCDCSGCIDYRDAIIETFNSKVTIPVVDPTSLPEVIITNRDPAYIPEVTISEMDPAAVPTEQSDIVTQSIVASMDTLEDLKHECLRDCSGSLSKICYFTFKVEWYITMSKGCYDCPHNLTDCLRPHCAFADGHERPIVTVNRQFPGPKIQVCVNDEIVVDVENDLGSDTTSIHWHGIHQRGTPYMDGVPFLTQCPIPPYTTFRYHFVADLPGTHYWHSHAGFQRSDGMFGAMIVRSSKKSDPLSETYDEDDPNHVFMLTDWMDKLGIDKFVNHHHTEHENKPYNILVNGIGKYKPLINSKGEKAFTPVQEIAVKKGRRYRMRTISNSIQNCPIVISVDNHTLLVIATDAHPIEPVRVKSFTIYGGERWDFVVEATEARGTYWINFQGLLDCDDRFKSAHQVAVLRYDGVEGFPTPLEKVSYKTTIPNGLNLNKLNAAPGDGTTFITAAEIRSTLHDDANDIKGTPDQTFWLDFDFYAKNSPFHHAKYYSFFRVEKKKRLFVPQINDISFKFPNVPPLSQPEDLDTSNFCNQSISASCHEKSCACPYVINLEKGALVELILVDRGAVYWANHPFHLHGHAFKVLAMGRLGEQTTLKKIQEMERRGEIKRNFNHPPTKDTVTVPDGGYTVIRFRADNPGYWLFHCHISFHVEVGMGLVFHVGERHHLPQVPANFPRCGSWEPKIDTGLKQKLRFWESTLDKHLTKVDTNLIHD